MNDDADQRAAAVQRAVRAYRQHHPDGALRADLVYHDPAQRSAVVAVSAVQYQPGPDGHISVIAEWRALGRSSAHEQQDATADYLGGAHERAVLAVLALLDGPAAGASDPAEHRAPLVPAASTAEAPDAPPAPAGPDTLSDEEGDDPDGDLDLDDPDFDLRLVVRDLLAADPTARAILVSKGRPLPEDQSHDQLLKSQEWLLQREEERSGAQTPTRG